MYRCLCGSIFDRPTVIRETALCGGFPRREKYLLCPACGLGEQYFDEFEEGDDPDGTDPAPDSSPGGADL